jgi:hypothetical protein
MNNRMLSVDALRRLTHRPSETRLITEVAPTLSRSLVLVHYVVGGIFCGTCRRSGFLANFLLVNHTPTIGDRPSGSPLFLTKRRQFMQSHVFIK